jgi:hypothetical protein
MPTNILLPIRIARAIPLLLSYPYRVNRGRVTYCSLNFNGKARVKIAYIYLNYKLFDLSYGDNHNFSKKNLLSLLSGLLTVP